MINKGTDDCGLPVCVVTVMVPVMDRNVCNCAALQLAERVFSSGRAAEQIALMTPRLFKLFFNRNYHRDTSEGRLSEVVSSVVSDDILFNLDIIY